MEQNARDDHRCTACGGNGVLLPDSSHGRELVCISCGEHVALDQRRGDQTPDWFEQRPICTDDVRQAWFHESLDPEKWCEPGKVVSACEAALWLCGYNPDWGKRKNGTRDPLAGVVDASMTDNHTRLLVRFERFEMAQPTLGLTLAQWRDLARRERFAYDERIDGLLPASTAVGGKRVASTAESTQSAARTRVRPDALTPIIRMARKEASDPDSPTSVWEVLVRFAQSPNPPAPIVGYAEGEIKYRADTEIGFKFFTQKALKNRIARDDQLELG